MALQDDSYNKFFGWQSAGAGGPITSAMSGLREAGQDIINATFDPQGAAHTKYASDQAAAAQAKIDAAAAQAKYQQDLATYNQESERIAAVNAKQLSDQQAADQAAAAQAATATAANAPNPYASFYGLTARQQQKAQANPRGAQRRGIALPPAGYVQPTNTAVATGSRRAERQAALAAPTAPTAPKEASQQLWKGWDQYYAGNSGATADFNKATSQQKTAYTDEYNKYKTGLPLIYQDLINYGISPEQVSSGQALTLSRQFGQEIIPTDYNEAMRIYGTTRGGASDQGQGLNIWTPTSQYATPTSQYAAGAWGTPTNTSQWTQLPKV